VSHFRPKEVLRRAQEAEKNGEKKEAANDYALLSVYLRRKRRFDDAKKMVDQAIVLTPQAGRLYLEKALCEWELGHPEQAKECVRQCARLGLEKKKLTTYLGYLEKDLAALPVLRECFFDLWLSVDRTASAPFLGLGKALLEQSKLLEARKTFLDGFVIDNENPDILGALEEVISKLGNNSEKEWLLRYRNGELKNEDLLVLLGSRQGFSNQKESLKSDEEERSPELKDLKELVDELEKELEMDSDHKFENIEPLVNEFRRKSNKVIGSDAQARLDLACAFQEMGRYRDAKDELSKVEVSNPLYPQAQYQLGTLLKLEGSELGAVGAFQCVLRIAQENSPLWKEAVYQLAHLYVRLGDKKHAVEMVTLLDKREPNYRTLKSLKANLGLDKTQK